MKHFTSISKLYSSETNCCLYCRKCETFGIISSSNNGKCGINSNLLMATPHKMQFKIHFCRKEIFVERAFFPYGQTHTHSAVCLITPGTLFDITGYAKQAVLVPPWPHSSLSMAVFFHPRFPPPFHLLLLPLPLSLSLSVFYIFNLSCSHFSSMCFSLFFGVMGECVSVV